MFFWTLHHLTADALALVVFFPSHKLVEILCGRQTENVNKLYDNLAYAIEISAISATSCLDSRRFFLAALTSSPKGSKPGQS